MHHWRDKEKCCIGKRYGALPRRIDLHRTVMNLTWPRYQLLPMSRYQVPVYEDAAPALLINGPFTFLSPRN